MRTIKDRIVKEKIPLQQCEVGDGFRFCSYAIGIPSGDLIVVKIKAISKDKVQLKYKSNWKWRDQRQNKVQKIDLPQYTYVERTRKADDRDRGDLEVKVCEGEILV